MGFLSSVVPGVRMFSSFLHPEKGYKKGQEQLNKYYGQAQDYLRPYTAHGEEAYGNLNTAMQNLLNPSDLYNQFSESYQTSPAAEYAMARAREHGLNSLSSLGLLGSSPAIQALQAGTAGIQAEDEARYLDNLFKQYIQGAQLAQGIYGAGAQAGGQMGQNAMNMGGESANMAFGKQNAPGQLFGSLLGTAANLAGGYMGVQGMNNLANAWKTGGTR